MSRRDADHREYKLALRAGKSFSRVCGEPSQSHAASAALVLIEFLANSPADNSDRRWSL